MAEPPSQRAMGDTLLRDGARSGFTEKKAHPAGQSEPQLKITPLSRNCNKRKSREK